jgi:hypothetical protein
MPRFFFSRVRPEGSATDIVGEDVADGTLATERAREIARELVSSQLENGQAPSGWIEVEDEEHRPVFKLPLRAVSS